MRATMSPIPMLGREKLGERHFLLTIVVALLLHISGLVVWTFSPKQTVHELQIRMLNIRLGDGDELTLEAPSSASASVPENVPQVEALIDKIAVSPTPSRPQPDKSEMQQYVREVNTPRLKKTGSKNGVRDAEIMSRYTQMISLWIQKFKIYPEEARAKGLKGSTVVRIRIDRRGNIHYYALERSTGIELLDRAAIDMIRRANPVPSVPNDYPAGESFEFLIPVNFSLI